MSRHNVWIPDDLWDRAQDAARLQSVEEDEDVSVSELIRRGLISEIRAIERKLEGTGGQFEEG